MRRGVWHQCGNRSQKLVEEQLLLGAGVGVILSPRDLSRDGAIAYAKRYRTAGADVLIDQQFFVPDFTNAQCGTYPISKFRTSVSALNKISDQDLIDFQNELRIDHVAFKASAMIAPAVVYEAGRADIVQLNSRLFNAAKAVASELSIPIYATVVLGKSVTSSDQTMQSTLSQATASNCDGWYFGFEFEEERIPSVRDTIRRCCAAGLTLACTGKPALHAYAGPMGLLSFGFGATGVGIGHSQNLWQFTRDRWAPPSGEGGGGHAPPRYFSKPLWGTIVYPDETTQLPLTLRNQIWSPSPFNTPVTSGLPWSRWDANKHLVYVLAQQYSLMAAETDPRKNAKAAIALLDGAVNLHAAIRQANVFLTDKTNVYQANWKLALEDLLSNNSADFDFLELLR